MNDSNHSITGNVKYFKFAETLSGIARERNVDSAEALIDQALAEFADRKFTIAVLGMLKRGKSTFCNAMLGMKDDRYAPTGKTPVSNVVTFFEKGEPCVTIFHEDGSRETGNIEEIANYTTEEKNPQNVLKIKHVMIRDNFPKMEPGVLLLDTPGGGSIFEHHDALLHEYLPKADAVIFMVTAQTPLTESEIDFIRELKKQNIQKFFFVINRKDQADDDELRDALEHNSFILGKTGINVSKLFPISAKMAMEGEWEESGMAALFAAIWEYLEPEKVRYPRFLLMTQLNAIIPPLLQGVDSEIQARLMNRDELKGKIDQLAANGIALEEKQAGALKQFAHDWEMAENSFFTELPATLNAVEAQMLNYIESINLFNYSSKKDHFPEEFECLIRKALEVVVKHFEERIAQAVGRYQLQCPVKILSRFERGSSTAFYGGIRETWKDRFLLAMCGAVGLIFANRTKNEMKDELRRKLPEVLNQISLNWQTRGKEEMNAQKEKQQNELFNLYQLEIEPITNALQNAMDDQSNTDASHDEELINLRNELSALQMEGGELLKELAK